jgi:hypothetical protein
MASTYTINSGVEKIGSGEQAGTWGTTTNTNMDIIDRAINGVGSIALSGTTHTLTTTDGVLSDGGYKVLVFTGALGANNTVTISPNDQDKNYLVVNSTTDSGSSGPYNVIITQGSGANATVLNAETAWVYADGGGSGAIVKKVSTDLLNDTTPQLGGNLDVNGKLIKFGDAGTAGTDDTLEFGADDDMQLYHDGTNSFIANKTGALKIATETSGIAVTIGHTTSETTIADNATVTGTLGVTGETTLATHLNMGDGDIIRLGDSNDLLIYHDATNSYIKNATGALKLATEDSGIAVTIGHTTSETTVADNLTVTGNGSVGGTLGVTGNVTLGALLIMPDVTSAKILVADGTSYQEVAVSGDVTIANTGAVTIAANAIETAMIADAQITTAKLAGSVAVIGMSAKVTVGAGTPTITASVNTSSIADNATGDFTITINTDFSNANYSAVVTAFDDDGTGRNVGDNITEAQAAGTIQIKTYRATPSESSTRGLFDPDGFFIICNPQ